MLRRILPGITGIISLLCALFSTTAIPSVVQASGSSPVVIGYKGDEFTWTGNPTDKLTQRTEWGYNDAPVVSPDGSTMAYASVAQVYVNAIAAHGAIGGAGVPPQSIWLMDVAHPGPNDANRIAGQPAYASIFDPKIPNHYTIRSNPTWSPDGKAVAWTEMTVSGDKAGNYQLVTYSTQIGMTTVLVPNLPVPASYEGYTVEDVTWGKTGLAVRIASVDTSQQGGLKSGGTINAYDTTGKLLSSSANVPNIGDFFWIGDFGMGNTFK